MKRASSFFTPQSKHQHSNTPFGRRVRATSRALPGTMHRLRLLLRFADHEPLAVVTDGIRSARLHRRCEASWLDGDGVRHLY